MRLKLFIVSIICLAITNTFAQSHPVDSILKAEMVFVEGGTFNMGCTTGRRDERPVHLVRLNDFYIGKYEVTQALWLQVMGAGTGVKTDCPACAVYDVSHELRQQFLNKLKQFTGKEYRLPTEAEWEYAATGGKQTKGYKYCGSNELEEVAWCAPNSGMKTHPVGQKKPNELGLYDMSGNVWELTQDWYKANFYHYCSTDNPVQLKKTLYRLVRGGSWRSGEQRCQARSRNLDVYDHHISNQGIRLVYTAPSQQFTSWVDSMDNYARNVFLPARKYQWTWQNAALLNTIVKQFEYASSSDKALYLEYVRKAMQHSKSSANGRMPNAVASALGMAFLYRITGEEKYKRICDKVYQQYLNGKRTKEGAVSHVPVFSELWDDTVFMIGEFLLGMYRATGDEKYVEELVKQIALHREKLQVKEWGLWVHGYDQSGWGHCLFCSEVHWATKTQKQSAEIWGRGNGWILVTLSDALNIVPRTHPRWNQLAGYLKEMVQHLPELQDTTTGHWYQLPVRKAEEGNFIESSCTAMFGYGIYNAIKLGLVNDETYKESVRLAYNGLRKYSVQSIGWEYLTTNNVCSATCIGDKEYYFKRKAAQGKAYGLAVFLLFGHSYEMGLGYRNIPVD